MSESYSINTLRVGTFNCTGIKSSKEYITHNLLRNLDIIALQETWLMPHDLSIPDALSNDFLTYSVSSVNVNDGLLRGRPYGGLTYMWHKRLRECVQVVTYGEDRILGLICKLEAVSILFLNVYLPTQCAENYDVYMNYLGKLTAIVNESETDAVCVVGDFNAAPDTHFFNELQVMCDVCDLDIADVINLPHNSFTHVNDGTLSSTWLDHFLVSKNINNACRDFDIL